MKDKAKKWLTITGCLVICAVLVGLIATRMTSEKPTDAPLPSQSSQPSDVTVTPPDTEKEKEIVVTPPEIPKDQASGSSGADYTGDEQTIQPDPKKPEYTEDELKDNTKTPSGEKVDTPPPAVDHDKVDKPKDEPKPKPDTPQGGDTYNGKIYVPGFGWIDDIGEGQGTVGESDGDINKPVGTM